MVFSCDGSHLLLVVTVWFTFLVSPPKNKTKKLTKTSVNKFSSYRQMTQMYLKPLFPLKKIPFYHFIVARTKNKKRCDSGGQEGSNLPLFFSPERPKPAAEQRKDIKTLQ